MAKMAEVNGTQAVMAEVNGTQAVEESQISDKKTNEEQHLNNVKDNLHHNHDNTEIDANEKDVVLESASPDAPRNEGQESEGRTAYFGGEDEDSIGQVSDNEVMLAPPPPVSFYCPPGLEGLMDVCQVLLHQGNFRYPDVKVQDNARTRFEVIDISRRLICFIEEVEEPFGADSFLYRGYNREKQEVLQIYNPGGATCLFCGFSMHCCHSRRCHYQVMVQAPVGNVVGFIYRTHTWLMQEYKILNSQEEHLLTLRGGPVDLEVYTPDLETGLGRISRQWVGIMRELSRSREDYGLSFPMDLDVRVKAVLIGAVISINWLYFKRQNRRDRT